MKTIQKEAKKFGVLSYHVTDDPCWDFRGTWPEYNVRSVIKANDQVTKVREGNKDYTNSFSYIDRNGLIEILCSKFFTFSSIVHPTDGTTRWALVSWTMNREIQMFTVAFMVNESHSKHLNFAVHGSCDQNPPCGAVFSFCEWQDEDLWGSQEKGKETDETWFMSL